MDPAPVVVVAHARSGSNSLVEIVSAGLPVPLLNEPFNPHFTSWAEGNPDHLGRVRDAASLDDVVADIGATHAGFKVLDDQLELPLLEHLLLRDDVRVIWLRRANLLETVVSNLVAVQTNLWRADDQLADRCQALEPLDLDELGDLLRARRRRIEEVESILDRRSGPTLRLRYEALYLDDTDAQLARLWRFLDVAPPPRERIARDVDPAHARMAAADTYGRVPNIAAVEAAFGGTDVGHLTYL